MSDLLVALGAGYLAARLVWYFVHPIMCTPLFVRSNYRGTAVTTSAGLVIPLAMVLIEAGRALAGTFGVGDPGGLTVARSSVLLLGIGFGLLGTIDDLGASGGERGFRGHVGALLEGRLTTGGLKLLGGLALSIVAVAPAAGESPARLAIDAILVALAANLGNLLDRRPGRAIKASVAGFAILAVGTSWAPGLPGVAAAVGAALALLLDDLHERLMLGDAGANVLGAIVGFGVVAACAPSTRTVVMVGMVVLNLAGEMVSFTNIIDAVPPLRALDRAGRRHRD